MIVNDPATIAPVPADAPPIVAQSAPPVQPHPVQSRPVAARLPVVSINEFHYAYVHCPDPMAAAHADVERARKLGVQYFQIDSVYDQWLR